MTDEKKDMPRDDRTIFRPLVLPPKDAAPVPAPADVPPADAVPSAETEGVGSPPSPPSAPPAPGSADKLTEVTLPPPASPPVDATTVEPVRETTQALPPTTAFTPRQDGQSIQVGDVLNHIFEVKRFIARGGMGEVFEGANVNSDERVAIKVMLPALAADPNVITMFRREAQTLTRLQHEALVQYRVLAQEPQLGVLYIVTEFIDGVNLSDLVGTIQPSVEELRGLLRRLASGLKLAHSFGAVHRDISPDNVLLPGGKLDEAKIIDFGIAKDVNPGSSTIIGSGFAGKLNYVAPEQLGDYDRDIGAWSDIYSLALVILAVASGKNVELGGSLVDAVDKRRAGVDVSGAPRELQPLLSKMLAADPAKRLRSMDDVLRELAAAPSKADSGNWFARPAVAPAEAGPAPSTPVAAPTGQSGKLFLIIGSALALLLAAATIWSLWPDGDDEVRQAVNLAIPTVDCSWLDLQEVDDGNLHLAGVAGDPELVRNRMYSATSSIGVDAMGVDFASVSPISQAGCSALDTYRQIRSPNAPQLQLSQTKFPMTQLDRGAFAGDLGALVSFRYTIGDPAKDFALFGFEEDGTATVIFASREVVDQAIADEAGVVEKLPDDGYKVDMTLNHSGWSGLLLVTGKGPFDADLVAPAPESRNMAWRERFLEAARRNGWQADMVWFETVEA